MLQQPDPTQAEAMRLIRARRHAEAAALLKKSLKKRPNEPGAIQMLAVCLSEAGRYDEAANTIRGAIKLRPRDPNLRCDLSQMLVGAERFDDAERALDEALAIDPAHPFATGARIELLQTVGRIDEAKTLALRAIDEHPGDTRILLAFASLAGRLDQRDRAVDLLRAHLDSASLPPDARATALFRLGNLLDALGRYDDAWATLEQANALVQPAFNPDAFERGVDRLIATWNKDTLAQLPRASRPSEQPVFILGMPRSGTSLVEQILASHPDVHGAGELPDLRDLATSLRATGPRADERIPELTPLTPRTLDDVARKYLASLHKRRARAARVTDKAPLNFLVLWLIDRAFPCARVIRCERHPLDTCLSCYTHHFHGAYGWAYRLEHLGVFYRGYQRLMEHWGATLEVEIINAPYEQIVDDLEGESRRLVESIGLPWDDACLDFHRSARVVTTLSNEQVRRPIYASSVGRWKNYRAALDPLRTALGLPENG